ncbi:hypothetical protein RhiirA1_401870 [Rhizophagus irregularis]|uniref:C2H2-type domain-containing protein n=1 Tax=Rhizophagus irregularis TaxID=588596 RepID=A0A2N0R0G7_9GLOM|nr:hypothetical protein RhiirA1_401870 [Rhizophagus irregularis]
MFTCLYQHCGVTFSRHATLCEHTKSHKGQAYWEILTDTSSNFNNLRENNITDQFNFIEFEQDVNNESDEQIENNDNEEQDAAYTEFMELASIHKFSDSAGNDVLKWVRKYHLQENIVLPTNMAQGREFINSMNIDHLLYLKTKVLTYEDEEYYLHYQPIFDAIKELLSNSDILKNCQWDFSPEYIINDNGQNERVYGEQ